MMTEESMAKFVDLFGELIQAYVEHDTKTPLDAAREITDKKKALVKFMLSGAA